MKKQPNFSSIDEYISLQKKSSQSILIKVRSIISKLVPDATEKIAYGVPTYVLKGNLVHFAVYEKHLGLYPGPDAINHFKQDLIGYVTSKGTVQFPLDQEMPYDLISNIVSFCVAERRRK